MARLKGDRLIALGNVGLFKTNYVMCPHADFGAHFTAWQNCSGSGVKKSSQILYILYSAYHLLFFVHFVHSFSIGAAERSQNHCAWLTLEPSA